MSETHIKEMEARMRRKAEEEAEKRKHELEAEARKKAKKLAEEHEKARKAAQKAAEAARKKREKARKEAERRAEKARRIEEKKVKRLRKQIPRLEKDFASMQRQLTQSQRQLNSLEGKLDQSIISELKQELGSLYRTQQQLKQQIDVVNNEREAVKVNVEQLDAQISQYRSQTKSLVTNWTKLTDKVRQNQQLGTQVADSLAKTSQQIKRIVQQGNDTFNYINEQTEEKIVVQNAELQRLEQEYELIKAEIALLQENSVTSTSAFLEIEAMRLNGYELKGISQKKDIDLWFEEENGSKRVALKVKPMIEEPGVKWLREIDISGLMGKPDFDEAQDQLDQLKNLGVDYEIVGKRKPKNPPPSTLEEWKKDVGIRDQDDDTSNRNRELA